MKKGKEITLRSVYILLSGERGHKGGKQRSDEVITWITKEKYIKDQKVWVGSGARHYSI